MAGIVFWRNTLMKRGKLFASLPLWRFPVFVSFCLLTLCDKKWGQVLNYKFLLATADNNHINGKLTNITCGWPSPVPNTLSAQWKIFFSKKALTLTPCCVTT
jgi:hypothetical protein